MTRLSVNLNKVALIRNSRGANQPDLLKVAKDCEAFGAEGITVHPRPDQRHIRYDDIPLLKEMVTTEFNIEGNPTKAFIDLVLKNKPHQVTLVPDKPGALTSDAGWDTVKEKEFLSDVLKTFNTAGIRTSLFVGTDLKMINGAKECGADRIELYTGPYAKNYTADRALAVADFKFAAEEAQKINIGLNAGHDLNLKNLTYFGESLTNLLEVSIGHALIIDSLYYGLQNTIQMYLKCLKTA